MSSDPTKRSKDHSVSAEPHLQGSQPPTEGSDHSISAEPHLTSRPAPSEYGEHTVWDEPILRPARPERAESFAEHYRRRRRETSPGRTWKVTLVLALAAGPFAVLGAIWGQMGTGATGILAIVVFGPAVEEMMKIAATAYVVERRPWLLSSRAQILLTAFAGGLVFAVIENFMYLYVYVPDPTPGLVIWRWTVCVILHAGCSTIAGMGLLRAWGEAESHGTRPELGRALPLVILAVVIHGAYNGAMVVLSMLDWQF